MSRRRIADFNFWPAFADWMLILVLIFTIILAAISVEKVKGQVKLKKTYEKQIEFVDDFANRWKVKKNIVGSDEGSGRYAFSVKGNDGEVVFEINKHLVRVIFTEQVLFGRNEYTLSQRGVDTIKSFSAVLAKSINKIEEIQIQGHTDNKEPQNTDGMDRDEIEHFKTFNLNLAFRRARSVYEMILSNGIDPTATVVSVSSFGKYKPRDRDGLKTAITQADLDRMNDGNKASSNRRIEVLLFYKDVL